MISVNIHAHDRDDHLIKVLESFISQTFKSFEINICETGNLQSTLEIAKQYSKLFKINYYCLHLKIVDRTKILNFLAKKSNGDVICICDADVIKNTDYLQEISSKLTRNTFLVQFVKYLTLRQRNIEFDNIFENECHKNIELNTGAKSQIAIYKETFLELGGYDENFFGWGYEDSDLYDRLERYGIKAHAQNSFGIHLYHFPCKVFKRDIFDRENLKIFNNNVNKTVIKNTVERKGNQWDPNVEEPIKLL